MHGCECGSCGQDVVDDYYGWLLRDWRGDVKFGVDACAGAAEGEVVDVCEAELPGDYPAEAGGEVLPSRVAALGGRYDNIALRWRAWPDDRSDEFGYLRSDEG